MTIYQQGTINTTALVVPDLYVQVVSPQNLVINGVPTNLVGAVGSAAWGPVNQPVAIQTMADYAAIFGPIVARQYDLGTFVAAAVQQGATAFTCVRVTDGTDAAASYQIDFAGGLYAVALTACYTGSVGNTIGISLTESATPGAWRFTVGLPGQVPEVFDGISGTTPALIWTALVSAINNGSGNLQGASALVVASLGTGTSTPVRAFGPQFLLGGADGASAVVSTTLVGQDVTPRTGMYALRSQGCSLGVLVDSVDPTTWGVQSALGLSEGIYMILTGPSGDTIADAIAVKQEIGLASYAAKLMFGDWIYWNDQVNGVLRLISPQGFVAGRLANLSPEQSSLNKPLFAVVGTQRSGTPGSGQNATYSDAELTLLFQNGIDVIANPQPGGAYWGVRCGHSTANNPAVWNDAYTRMTNYIAATLSAAMGVYVGQVINNSLFLQIRSTLLSFLQGLLAQGILGKIGNVLPYSVICNATNNPIARTSLGYVQSDVQIQFQGINEKFLVNIDGGQTVIVQQQVLVNTSA